MPSTRAGRRASRAISPIGSDDVLLANTQLLGGPRLDLRQHLRFSSEVLEDGLDHEVRPARSRVTSRRRRQRSMRCATSRAVRLPRFRRSSKTSRRVPQPAAERLAARVLEAHGDARLRGDAAMPAPIRPAPSTPSFSTSRGSRALRVARVLLDLLGGEEDRHQRARDVRDGELAEVRAPRS